MKEFCPDSCLAKKVEHKACKSCFHKDDKVLPREQISLVKNTDWIVTAYIVGENQDKFYIEEESGQVLSSLQKNSPLIKR